MSADAYPHPNIQAIVAEEPTWTAAWETGYSTHRYRQIGSTQTEDGGRFYWEKEIERCMSIGGLQAHFDQLQPHEISSTQALSERFNKEHDPRWFQRRNIARSLSEIWELGYLLEDENGDLVADADREGAGNGVTRTESITITVKPSGLCAAGIRNPFVLDRSNRPMLYHAYIAPTGRSVGVRFVKYKNPDNPKEAQGSEKRTIFYPLTIVTQLLAKIDEVKKIARQETDELEELSDMSVV